MNEVAPVAVPGEKAVDIREKTAEIKSRQQAAEAPKLGLVAVESEPEKPSSQRRPAPEAHQLHGQQQAPEHIGHMLIAAEAPALRHVQKMAPEMAVARAKMEQTIEVKARPLTAKRIETLSRAELLELSERVMIDGASLRQIYENHLIGERGLRRLLTEYMHGSDIKKALRKEVLEHEMDFERDPAMRDHAQHGSDTATGGGTIALDTLIQKAASVDGGSATTAAEAFTDHASQQAIQQERDRRRQLIDIAMSAVIAILAVAVIILFITRR